MRSTTSTCTFFDWLCLSWTSHTTHENYFCQFRFGPSRHQIKQMWTTCALTPCVSRTEGRKRWNPVFLTKGSSAIAIILFRQTVSLINTTQRTHWHNTWRRKKCRRILGGNATLRTDEKPLFRRELNKLNLLWSLYSLNIYISLLFPLNWNDLKCLFSLFFLYSLESHCLKLLPPYSEFKESYVFARFHRN